MARGFSIVLGSVLIAGLALCLISCRGPAHRPAAPELRPTLPAGSYFSVSPEPHSPPGRQIPAECRKILENATKFELLSLEPEVRRRQPPDGFHSFKILGSTLIENAETRKQLVAAFE